MSENDVTPIALGAINGVVVFQYILRGIAALVAVEASVTTDKLHRKLARLNLAIPPISKSLIMRPKSLRVKFSSLGSTAVFGMF